MSQAEEAGSDRVTASTHAFAEIDAQVFPGPGRGATPSEAAATDRWGGPSATTVEAYRRMFDIVAKHQRAHGERRDGMTAGAKRRRTRDRVVTTTPARLSRPSTSTGSVVVRRAASGHLPEPSEMTRLSDPAAATRVPRRVQPTHSHRTHRHTH